MENRLEDGNRNSSKPKRIFTNSHGDFVSKWVILIKACLVILLTLCKAGEQTERTWARRYGELWAPKLVLLHVLLHILSP